MHSCTDNNWEGSRNAGEGGSEGPDTREVRDTLASTCHSLSCSFRVQSSEFNWSQQLKYKEYKDGWALSRKKKLSYTFNPKKQLKGNSTNFVLPILHTKKGLDPLDLLLPHCVALCRGQPWVAVHTNYPGTLKHFFCICPLENSTEKYRLLTFTT